MMNKIKKPIWYKNPVYYLAVILLIWGLHLLFDTLHTVFSSVVFFNSSVLDLPLVIILAFSLALILEKSVTKYK